MNSQKTPQTARNREETRRRLIQAVGTLLSEHGFTALGVNAVARQAGVDKVLIYRYFGGLAGLMGAFGREGDFWPSVDELAGGDIETFAQLPLEEKVTRFAYHFVDAIQRRPLTQEIMAWEMVERNDLTVELETIRETMMLRFIEMFFPEMQKRIDMQALSAIFGAAISYLVCRSRHIRYYSGVDLQSEAGWERLKKAMGLIVRGIMAQLN